MKLNPTSLQNAFEHTNSTAPSCRKSSSCSEAVDTSPAIGLPKAIPNNNQMSPSRPSSLWNNTPPPPR